MMMMTIRWIMTKMLCQWLGRTLCILQHQMLTDTGHYLHCWRQTAVELWVCKCISTDNKCWTVVQDNSCRSTTVTFVHLCHIRLTAVDVSLTQPDVYRLKTPENEAHGVQIIPNYRYKLLLTTIMITRRALGRAHVPPTKRCSNGLVNKKLSWPRDASCHWIFS